MIVLPVGSVEQHGHHLPLDVDVKLANAVCLAAGERAPETMLVLPPVSYGYCHHVMDFPGTINVSPTTFVEPPDRHRRPRSPTTASRGS